MVDSLPNLWQPIILPIILVTAYLSIIVLAAEFLHHRWAIEGEITRKVVHIGAGNVILLAWWLQIPAWIGVTAAVFTGIVTLISHKFPILPGVNSIGRKSLGTSFYALSLGVLVAYFWEIHQPQYAAIGILTMSYGDGMAALIGQRFGKHKYKVQGITKSWEGSLTMGVVSYGVCSLILVFTLGNPWQVWLISLMVALVATGLECFSWWGIDNLTVPGASALTAYTLVQLWGFS